MGFFIDLFIEICTSIGTATMMLSMISLYGGLCAYTKAMVDDLKGKLRKINESLLVAKQSDGRNCMDTVLAIVEEIRFHQTIIG